MEYCVVQSKNLSGLVRKVKTKISEGWIVQGGVGIEILPEEVQNETPEVDDNAQMIANNQDDLESDSHPNLVNDEAIPVDWQLQGQEISDDHNIDYEEDEEIKYIEEDVEEDDAYEEIEEDESEEEAEIETQVIYLKRYVQALTRPKRWNRKFSLDSTGIAGGRFGTFNKLASLGRQKQKSSAMQGQNLQVSDNDQRQASYAREYSDSDRGSPKNDYNQVTNRVNDSSAKQAFQYRNNYSNYRNDYVEDRFKPSELNQNTSEHHIAEHGGIDNDHEEANAANRFRRSGSKTYRKYVGKKK